MRRHRATRFGQHARRLEAELRDGLGERLHDGRCVLLEAVVDRAVRARARAFVVDAKAAADIEVVDGDAGFLELDDVAHGLAHAAGDVAHIRHLRAHVEMKQLQRVRELRGLELVEQIEQLPRRQPELALVAAGVLPLAGAEAGQAHAHAEQRLDAERARFVDDVRELARLLDHDVDFEPELAADQREAHVLAILVAVADDDAARPGEREHRHQFRFRARFEAEAFTAARGKLAGDAFLLVDLDRIDRGVAAGIVPFAHRLGERGLQPFAPVAQDVAEADQQRQARALRLRRRDHVGQADRRTVLAARAHRAARRRRRRRNSLRPSSRSTRCGARRRCSSVVRSRGHFPVRDGWPRIVTSPVARACRCQVEPVQSAPPPVPPQEAAMSAEKTHRARLVHRAARTLGLVDRLSHQVAPARRTHAVPDDRDLRLDRLGQADGHRRLHDGDHARQFPLPRDDDASRALHARARQARRHHRRRRLRHAARSAQARRSREGDAGRDRRARDAPGRAVFSRSCANRTAIRARSSSSSTASSS